MSTGHFQALLDHLEAGDSLDEFLDDFPTVTREQPSSSSTWRANAPLRTLLRVLLDESLPRGLRSLLSDHDVPTAQEMGWAGIDNGELLRRASAFDVLITADRGIEHQQNLETLEITGGWS